MFIAAKTGFRSDSKKKVVLKAIYKYGSEYRKPAFDALNGAVSYDDLKILRLYSLSRKKGGLMDAEEEVQ